MLSTLTFDLRLALRNMRRYPGFAFTCVVVLAVGIGAVTTMFSTLHGAVLRPLPFPDSQRLVWVWATTDTGQNNSLSGMDYFDYREQCDSFASLGSHSLWQPSRVITGDGEPERVASTKVSRNLFETLGVTPSIGRSFTPEEEVFGGPDAVILSHGFWTRRLGADPGVVGSPITIDGSTIDVVGIMPQGFAYPIGVDLWFPMLRGGPDETPRGNNNFFIIGRLADGVTLDQARAQMDGIAGAIATANPDVKRGWGVRLVPLHERFFGSARPVMLMLMAATSLVLLIAVANLSSLFLAKIMSRRGELAVRRSLGATRGLVARQLLTESLVLTSFGAVCGIALAALSLHVLKSLSPAHLPRLHSISIDGTVLLITILVTTLTGVLFGALPALRASKVSLSSTLREGRHSTEGAHSFRLRSLLVAAQIALSLALLVISGLLIRSTQRLQQVDPGFDVQSLLTVDVQLPALRYPGPEERERALADALARLRQLPGVTNAAAADQLPFFGGPWNRVFRADRPPDSPADRFPATRRMVSDGYFETLGVPILTGRGLEPSDSLAARPVTVISKALADGLFAGENPLGRVLVLPWGDGIHMEIVGVIGDVRDYGLAADLRPVFYLPLRQYPQDSWRLVVRTRAEPSSLLPDVRATIKSLEKDAPLFNIGTMAGWRSDSTSETSFSTYLLTAFAVIALILACTGLYGVMTQFVSERTREIGIRVAIGARPQHILRWVLARGAVLLGGGLAVGLVATLAFSRVVQSMLFATEPSDPLTYGAVSLILVTVALFACLVPAHRAVRSDPNKALRNE